MIIIFVVFIDQLIDYPINRTSLTICYTFAWYFNICCMVFVKKQTDQDNFISRIS